MALWKFLYAIQARGENKKFAVVAVFMSFLLFTFDMATIGGLRRAGEVFAFFSATETRWRYVN